MSDTTTRTDTSGPAMSAGSGGAPRTSATKDLAPREDGATPSVLATGQGRTTISDTVVAKIAGIAVREVSGVHALGGGTARAVGMLRERIPGAKTNHSQGVSVEVGERQAAVDLQLVAEYGVALGDLAEAIRRNVIASIERMTSLEVTEVNIEVQDVYLESDDESDDDSRNSSRDERSESRVQ